MRFIPFPSSTDGSLVSEIAQQVADPLVQRDRRRASFTARPKQDHEPLDARRAVAAVRAGADVLVDRALHAVLAIAVDPEKDRAADPIAAHAALPERPFRIP